MENKKNTEQKDFTIPVEKLKQIRRIADDVYHDLVSSNNPTHDEWCSSPKNLKAIMSIVDNLIDNGT
jgi:hypothetical protein